MKGHNFGDFWEKNEKNWLRLSKTFIESTNFDLMGSKFDMKTFFDVKWKIHEKFAVFCSMAAKSKGKFLNLIKKVPKKCKFHNSSHVHKIF